MTETTRPPKPFKICPFCAHVWRTRADFLVDPETRVDGYQVSPDSLGLFIFSHLRAGCHTSFAIDPTAFADLHNGPIYRKRLKPGDAGCTGACLHQGDLSPCPAECECAYVRAILQHVKNWPKRPA